MSFPMVLPMTLPLAQVERIMRNAGADKVSEDAVRLLRSSTEELGEELATDAVRIARNDGRDSISIDDILDAIEA